MENKDIIEEYILGQREEIQEILLKTKESIEKVLPRFERKLSWGMPTYKDKKNIIHFAPNKEHLGIYPGSFAIEKFSEELKDYKTSKGAIQFLYDKEIPYDLIGRIAIFNFQDQDK